MTCVFEGSKEASESKGCEGEGFEGFDRAESKGFVPVRVLTVLLPSWQVDTSNQPHSQRLRFLQQNQSPSRHFPPLPPRMQLTNAMLPW